MLNRQTNRKRVYEPDPEDFNLTYPGIFHLTTLEMEQLRIRYKRKKPVKSFTIIRPLKRNR